MRVPHEPQKANPGFTGRPQLGQMMPSGGDIVAGGLTPANDAGELAGRGVGVRGPTSGAAAATGALAARLGRVPAAVMVPALTVEVGAGPADAGIELAAAPPIPAGMAPGVGVSGAGILGESFQGMPPRGFNPGWDGGLLPISAGSGGNTVRAVSSGSGSRAEGRGSGFAAPLSSLPHPRQNL
jgi:hypothetical protein